VPDFANFLSDESGVTMIEYGLMVMLIAIVCIVAVTLIGTNLNKFFNAAATSI
jgi:pilus assembly protein Flp/PilA